MTSTFVGYNWWAAFAFAPDGIARSIGVATRTNQWYTDTIDRLVAEVAGDYNFNYWMETIGT